MISILTLSDTHSQHKKLILPEADILVHAGDLTSQGNQSETNEVLDWLKGLSYKYKQIIFIGGNHDFWMESHPDDIFSQLKDFPNIKYLLHSSTMYKGIKFYGEPVQPWFYDWAWNIHRDTPQMKEVWERVNSDTDILITHGPPQGYGDITTRGENVGCVNQLLRLHEIKPKLVICGHIHEQNGLYPIEDINTLVINTAICNRGGYKPTQTPYLINFNEDTKEVKSILEVKTNKEVYND